MNHLAAMDSIDPSRRVQLVVDEWGTWFDVEPGTNPGFLYQQSTMRDSIVASLALNIFNKHADRLMMANIAQTVNVLQSVILTDGEKMVKTPTYYAFKMFKEHQNNTLLGSFLTTDTLISDNDGHREYPQLLESASIDEDGVIVATLVNTSLDKAAPIQCQIADRKVASVKAEIITGDCRDKNEFDKAEAVSIQPFDGVTVDGDSIAFTVPACSVLKLTISCDA